MLFRAASTTLLLVILTWAAPLTAQAQSPAGTARVAYYGYDNCVELTNEVCRVVLCHQAGGRVLEVHAVTGPGDLHLRIVARSNEHLHDVLQRVLQLPGITRTETQLVLHTSIQRTVADLVASR